MESPQTLQQAIQYFSDYENCRSFMVSVRWPDGKVRCPNCGSEKVGYLEKARVYRCYGDHPKQKFSLKVGTIFEDSPIPLEKWLPAVWLTISNITDTTRATRCMDLSQKTHRTPPKT
jgi:transposase-like zinc ribbon protein